MYKIYIELLEKIFWFEFSITVFLTGIMGAYMKLYDKNSWLYKESQKEKWPYNTGSMATWRIIFTLTFVGGAFSIAFLGEIITKLIEILK